MVGQKPIWEMYATRSRSIPFGQKNRYAQGSRKELVFGPGVGRAKEAARAAALQKKVARSRQGRDRAPTGRDGLLVEDLHEVIVAFLGAHEGKLFDGFFLEPCVFFGLGDGDKGFGVAGEEVGV